MCVVKMLAFFNRIIEWFKSLFWKEEMELTLVGLQNSGKTTFVNVIAVGVVGVKLGVLIRALNESFNNLACSRPQF